MTEQQQQREDDGGKTDRKAKRRIPLCDHAPAANQPASVPSSRPGALGDDELAAIIGAFIAGRVPIHVDEDGQFGMFYLKTAGPKAAAALAEWLAVDGAADNLKRLDLNFNKFLGDDGIATIITDGLLPAAATPWRWRS